MLKSIEEIQNLAGMEEANKLVKERKYGKAVEKFGVLLAEVSFSSFYIFMDEIMFSLSNGLCCFLK